MMRKNIATVDDRVAHGLVGIINADLSANTPSETLLRPLLHVRETRKILLYRSVAIL